MSSDPHCLGSRVNGQSEDCVTRHPGQVTRGSSKPASYTYDSLYRLTDVVGSNWRIHWEFDSYGNRTSQTPNGTAVGKVLNPTYGYVNNKHASSFAYDAAGNILTDGAPSEGGHT